MRRPPRHLSDPQLVVANAQGDIFEVPELLALGRSGGTWVRPQPADYQPLPEGTVLFRLPDRRPVGWDPRTGKAVVLHEYQGHEVFAAATFLPPAHTALYLSPWQRQAKTHPLPLYAYCAIGWRDGAWVAPAIRVDPDIRQDVGNFDEAALARGAAQTLLKYPGNRLVEHLVRNCALTYCCPAARNFTLGRWEAPIPTSPACNADCVGCISLQPGGEVPVTQPRLTFAPTPEEMAEFAVPHLESADRAIVSFGQGCEGEPLLRADAIETAIREIRRHTTRGTINLNTNASRPDAVRRLVDAGLNAIRISLNSCQAALYAGYYRPRGYGLDDVLESGRAVTDAGGTVSFNYLMFPGLTDTAAEFEALETAVERAGTQVLQMRNLNIDPDLYLASLGLPPDLPPGFGLPRWMKRVRKQWPQMRFGYFNPPKDGGPIA